MCWNVHLCLKTTIFQVFFSSLFLSPQIPILKILVIYHTSVTKAGIYVFVIPFTTTGGGNVFEWTSMISKKTFRSFFLIPHSFFPSPYSNF